MLIPHGSIVTWTTVYLEVLVFDYGPAFLLALATCLAAVVAVRGLKRYIACIRMGVANGATGA